MNVNFYLNFITNSYYKLVRLQEDAYFRISGLIVVVTLLNVLALLLINAGITTIFGGYIYAFSILGLRWPKQLLYIYAFFVSYNHREFTYLTMQIDSVPIYITEWVILILSITGMSHLRETVKKYWYPLSILLVYLLLGLWIFIETFPRWGFVQAMRDFVIVYYAIFALIVMLNIRNEKDYRYLVYAFILGTIPNMIADTLNFLYLTFPSNYDQQNNSMMSSYFYIIGAGFCFPYLFTDNNKINKWPSIYIGWVLLDIFMYSYSKTAMIAFLLMLLTYLILRFKKLERRHYMMIAAVMIIPIIFTPSLKINSIAKLVNPNTFLSNNRMLLVSGSMRDFSEYPYGIGFGSPIFGKHSNEMIRNLEKIHAPHNSYITVIRRMGVIGGMLFFAVLTITLMTGYRNYRNFIDESNDKKMALGNMLALIGPISFCMGHVVLEGPFLGIPFWIIVGSTYFISCQMSNGDSRQVSSV